MRRIIVSLSLIAACAHNAHAQEPMALSLQAAMDYAVKNNAMAKNARIGIAIQDAVNKQVTAIALPQANAKGEFTEFFNMQKAFLPGDFFNQPGTVKTVNFTPKYATTASATASQILFDGGVLVALQARKSIIELTTQNSLLTDEMLRYNVQKAYYSLIISRKQLSIISSSLASLRSIANDIAKLKESGFVEKIEVDRTNVQVNNLATDSLRINSLLAISEQALKYGMGMDINTPIVLTDTSVEHTIQQGLEMINTPVNYNNRTELSLLNTQQKLNNYNLKRYKYAALPTLAVVGSMGLNYSSNRFQNMTDFVGPRSYQFFSFGALQLNVPIFSGFKRVNQVREAKLNMDKTQNDIERQKQTIEFEHESAKTTLKNSFLQLKSQEQNLILAKTVVDLAEKKYKAGVGSNIEVNQAQTELLRAQNNYFNSLLEVINAQSDLQKALGNFK